VSKLTLSPRNCDSSPNGAGLSDRMRERCKPCQSPPPTVRRPSLEIWDGLVGVQISFSRPLAKYLRTFEALLDLFISSNVPCRVFVCPCFSLQSLFSCIIRAFCTPLICAKSTHPLIFYLLHLHSSVCQAQFQQEVEARTKLSTLRARIPASDLHSKRLPFLRVLTSE
jgi:hypothetical protein